MHDEYNNGYVMMHNTMDAWWMDVW